MSLFDRLVDQALSQQVDLAPLRVVVEKELLHHDVMRVLSDCGLLDTLCFIGGTCLRACYGSNRLSEDLDFTGGVNFDRAALAQLKPLLTERLQTKYGLAVEVSEPKKEVGNVDTWKLNGQRPKICRPSVSILMSALFRATSLARRCCSTHMEWIWEPQG